MTPSEHEILALKMQLLAQQVLLDWLSGLWRMRIATVPEPERSQTLEAMRTKLQEKKEEYSTIALPWLDAANSDLQAALFQEAFAEISEKVLATAAKGWTPQELERIRADGGKSRP